jgi:lysophospholipase L1-like esterase
LKLHLPRTPHQTLRVFAAVTTVVLLVSLGSVGGSEPRGPTYHHYVALGDSYTAAPFVPLTDVAYGCNRSSNNYPRLVAAALHIEDLQDRSCSGAQTADLPGSQRTADGQTVPPQFGALDAETDLVTVGIGANDHRLYARMATVCRRSMRICRLYDQRDQLGWIVDQLRPQLASTLEQVRELAPRARVLLVGYPQLLPARGDCARLPRMRPEDRRTFRAINARLRGEMRAAATDAGVEFVDFYAASLGHDICAQHPWIQGRTGSRRQGAALHPLPAGQRALARLVLDFVRKEPRPCRGCAGSSH